LGEKVANQFSKGKGGERRKNIFLLLWRGLISIFTANGRVAIAFLETDTIAAIRWGRGFAFLSPKERCNV
jgi:hypothetical protein